MYKIMVEFAGNIDSRELYNMVEKYEINVTDMDGEVILYGMIHSYELCSILSICEKFGITEVYVNEVN